MNTTDKAKEYAEEYAKNVVEGRSFVVSAYLAGYAEALRESSSPNGMRWDDIFSDFEKFQEERSGYKWSSHSFKDYLKEHYKSPVESEAVEFAEWLGANSYNDFDGWGFLGFHN